MKKTIKFWLLAVMCFLFVGCGNAEDIRTGNEATGKPTTEITGVEIPVVPAVIIESLAIPADSPAPLPQEATPLPASDNGIMFVPVGEMITISVVINADSKFEAFKVLFDYDPEQFKIVSFDQAKQEEGAFWGLVVGNPVLASDNENSTKASGILTASVAGASPIKYNGRTTLCTITLVAKKAGNVKINPTIPPDGLALFTDRTETTTGSVEPIEFTITEPMKQ